MSSLESCIKEVQGVFVQGIEPIVKSNPRRVRNKIIVSIVFDHLFQFPLIQFVLNLEKQREEDSSARDSITPGSFLRIDAQKLQVDEGSGRAHRGKMTTKIDAISLRVLVGTLAVEKPFIHHRPRNEHQFSEPGRHLRHRRITKQGWIQKDAISVDTLPINKLMGSSDAYAFLNVTDRVKDYEPKLRC